ncbi:hypothetical protein [Flavimaricola marinus]|uniref:hypothetical protein n=1 Tax=Flavimaricola marinus TaxID=1819565 RepID=UPI001056C21F|nr:hypothetical protein [Flavimaricola marinus]
MEEQLAILVIDKLVPLNIAIRLICRNNEAAPAKSLLLATISFVTHIEATDSGKRKSRLDMSLQRHKAALALAADVSALDGDTMTCRDLIDFWEISGDEFFLV